MRARRLGLTLLFCAGAAANAQTSSELYEFRFAAQPALPDAAVEPHPAPVAVPPPAAQPPAALERDSVAPRELLDAIDARLEAVRAIEARDGPRSRDLVGELELLGELYEQAGDPVLAIASFERALDVVRMNDGLHSLNQAPLIEAVIRVRTAAADFEAAAKLDTALLELAARSPGDARVVRIIAAVADREMDVARRFVDYGPGPQFNMSLSSGGWWNEYELSPREIAIASLRRARWHYNQAIALAQGVPGYDIAELFAIEGKMIRSLYYEATERDLQPPGAGSRSVMPGLYTSGEAVFLAHVQNSAANRRTAAAVARAIVMLADWQLLYSNNATALATYRTAYDLLADGDAPAQAVGELLTPAVPVALPLAEPAGGAETPRRGYVDVSLVVSRYGTPRNVAAVGASPGTPPLIVRRAKQHAASSRYRPRLDDGVAVRADYSAARYYYY